MVCLLLARAVLFAGQDQFRMAQDLLMRGDLTGALQAATDGLRSEPRSVEGLNLLGIIYDRQGQFDRAEESFHAALRLDPAASATHNNLGNHYLLVHKADRAEQEFRQTLQLHPQNATANFNLGSLLLARGEARAGVGFLERVHPLDPEAGLALVAGYLDLGEKQRALTLATKLSSDAGNNAQMHFSLGVTLGSKHQYEPAIRELEAANAQMPGTFEVGYNLGQAYLRSGKYDQASASLRAILDRRPDSVPALCLLAEAHSGRHDYAGALRELQRAHEIEPRNTDVYFLTAQICAAHGLYSEASSILSEALTLAQPKPELRAALAQSYFDAGKRDQAIAEFERMVKEDPSAGSLALLGRALERMGRFEEAKRALESGLAKDPHNAVCLYVRGTIADKEGDQAAAATYLAAAVKAAPDFGDPLYLLGKVKLRQQKVAEAAALLRRATAASPGSAKVYYELALAERRMGRPEPAAAALRQFAELSNRRKTEQSDLRQALANAAQLQQTSDPRSVCLLVDAYLRSGLVDKAQEAAAGLGDAGEPELRAQIAVGTLFAKYRYYRQAAQQFERVLTRRPESLDAKYDLALASIQSGQFERALAVLLSVPEPERKNDYDALVGDADLHAGRLAEAAAELKSAIEKNPENDQYIALLAMVHLKAGSALEAGETLRAGLARLPQSGLLYWARGVAHGVAKEPNAAQQDLLRAIDLMPEWQGGYAVLKALYLGTGQAPQAAELEVRIQTLFAGETPEPPYEAGLLETALLWADRT
jgi:tetratricopeptide (TPR) repeat protein